SSSSSSNPCKDNTGGSTNRDVFTAMILLKQQKWFKFSGREGEDITAFIQQFTDFRGFEIPEIALVKVALNNLQGAASGIIGVVHNNMVPSTLEELAEKLKEYFPPLTITNTLKGLVIKLDKGPGSGNLIEFIIDTYKDSKEIDMPESMLIKDLWSRLSKKEYSVTPPQSIKDLLTLIRDGISRNTISWEKTHNSHHSINTPKSSPSLNNKSPPRPCKHCNGNHWNSDCPSNSIQRISKFHSKDKLKCFICNSTEHLANVCPTKAKSTQTQKTKDQNNPHSLVNTHKSTDLPEISITINGTDTHAIIDTGASYSSISRKLATDLDVIEYDVMPCEISTGNGKVMVTTQAVINIKINNWNSKLHVLILENQPNILIIGNDFLQKHQSILDLHKQLLVLKPNVSNKENIHNQIEVLLSNYIKSITQHNKSTTASDIHHHINIPQNTNPIFKRNY
ncbi:hypothetical protein ENBRE01_3411, partial [Enteropsectra breve]